MSSSIATFGSQAFAAHDFVLSVALGSVFERAGLDEAPAAVKSDTLAGFLRDWRTQVEGAAKGVIWRDIDELGATDLDALAELCRQAALALASLDPKQRLDIDEDLRVVRSDRVGPTAYQVVAVLEAIVILIAGRWPPEPESTHIHYVGYPDDFNRRLSRHRA